MNIFTIYKIALLDVALAVGAVVIVVVVVIFIVSVYLWIGPDRTVQLTQVLDQMVIHNHKLNFSFITCLHQA